MQPLRMLLGSAAAYLLPAGDGYVLIDAGMPGMAGRFFHILRRRGIPPDAIRLIVITHVHYDHVGSLRAIQARCGAPVMVHENEADWLAEGTVVVPGGANWWRKIETGALRLLVRLLPVRFAAYTPDIIIKNGQDGLSLAAFGLDGRVFHTPGHSVGSMSVLVANGDAAIGDLAVNNFPFGLGPIYQSMLDDLPTLLDSWQKLLDAGVTRLYPGHGRPFDAAILREKLAARR